MRKRILIILSLIVTLLSAVNSLQAKTVSLDPAHVRLSIEPGEVKSGTINVDNPSEQEIKVKVYLDDWRYSSYAEGTKEFFPSGTTPFSCSSWINFSPAEFIIPSFGRQVVNYTARLPHETKGTHFSVMFFETDLADVKDNADSSVRLKARLGALFSIEAQGRLQCEAGFDDIKLKKEKDLLKISANFRNKGNTDIAPKIMFHIIDMQGKVFLRGKFSDIFTLPQDQGEVFAESRYDFGPGSYILVITMDLGKRQPQVLEVPIKASESQINLASNG